MMNILNDATLNDLKYHVPVKNSISSKESILLSIWNKSRNCKPY